MIWMCCIFPANEIAEDIGSTRLTNMVMLGALLEKLPVLPVEAVEQALRDHLPARHKHLLEKNFQAMRRGAQYARQEMAAA